MKFIAKIFFFILLFSFQMIVAQKVVKGKITDELGTPLPGVSIIEGNIANGTTTDFDGLYNLILQTENASLSFSYLGFQTVTVEVGSKKL
jgi:hypothetical protein